jgi:hypothetical protein
MRRLSLAASAYLLLACPANLGKHGPDDAKSAKHADAKQDANADARQPDAKQPDAKQPDAKQPDDAKPADAKPDDAQADGAPAKLLPNAPLPLADLLGKPPADVQKRLGEPTGKGMQRTSCVRFLPERIWFECNYAHQRYNDTTGTYKAVQVSYEDGKAAAVAFEGIPGEGAFDPVAALAKVGLELPSAPRPSEPAEGVRLWSWFNSEARLVVDGLQYRVEVSTVDDKWENGKVEIILNHPLDAAQQSRIKEVRGKSG